MYVCIGSHKKSSLVLFTLKDNGKKVLFFKVLQTRSSVAVKQYNFVRKVVLFYSPLSA